MKYPHKRLEFRILMRHKIINYSSCFQILTKDSVTVFVNAIMFYKVKDPISAVSNVDDYSASARLLSATTLRNVLGTKSLKEILSDRETIARDMQELLYEATEPWGVDVERVEVKGIIIMKDRPHFWLCPM